MSPFSVGSLTLTSEVIEKNFLIGSQNGSDNNNAAKPSQIAKWNEPKAKKAGMIVAQPSASAPPSGSTSGMYPESSFGHTQSSR